MRIENISRGLVLIVAFIVGIETLMAGAVDAAEPEKALAEAVEAPAPDEELLDFSQSQFGIEHLTTEICDCLCAKSCDIAALVELSAFIAVDNPRVDERWTADLILRVAADYPLVPVDYAKEIIARESSFDPKAHNRRTNCYGFWQLMYRWHFKRMTRMGWDWKNPEHNLRYGFWHITEGLAKQGITEPEQVTPEALYRATWPWEVRPAAYRAWRAAAQ